MILPVDVKLKGSLFEVDFLEMGNDIYHMASPEVNHDAELSSSLHGIGWDIV